MNRAQPARQTKTKLHSKLFPATSGRIVASGGSFSAGSGKWLAKMTLIAIVGAKKTCMLTKRLRQSPALSI